MNNLSSYCGLVDAKIRASDKDLPVLPTFLRNRFTTDLLSRIENCNQKISQVLWHSRPTLGQIQVSKTFALSVQIE